MPEFYTILPETLGVVGVVGVLVTSGAKCAKFNWKPPYALVHSYRVRWLYCLHKKFQRKKIGNFEIFSNLFAQ